MNFIMDLQLFGGGKGGSSTTNVQSYTPTAEEIRLQKQAADYSEAVAPNALALNNYAMGLLRDSLGTVQVDYNTMNKNAQNQIANATQGYNNLANGQLPTAYTQNMADAIRSGVNSTYGTLLNDAANRGVLNSSVTSKGLDDISKNVSDTMAGQYINNINQLDNIYSRLIDSATQPTTTAAAAQEAAIAPAQSLWSSSLGLNGAGLGALNAVAGKGTTTSTQTTSGGGGGFFSGLLGGIGSGLGGALFCFPAGTKISMADGTEKNIEDIDMGDVVATDSGDDAIVVEVMKPHTNEVYEITCENGSVRTTATQPLMMADGENYIFAGDLTEGVELRRAGEVKDVRFVGSMKVYDFKTSGDNQYIADGFVAMGGDGSIWGGDH